MATTIAETERQFGMDTSVEDCLRELKFGLVEVVYEWARGMVSDRNIYTISKIKKRMRLENNHFFVFVIICYCIFHSSVIVTMVMQWVLFLPPL